MLPYYDQKKNGPLFPEHLWPNELDTERKIETSDIKILKDDELPEEIKRLMNERLPNR